MKRTGWGLVIIGIVPLVIELSQMARGVLYWPDVHNLYEALFTTELILIGLGVVLIALAKRRR
ncbi:MAG: hypothetical protein RLZZ164_499 [Actinomycetota bacterium]|jgi:hypothetical protein